MKEAFVFLADGFEEIEAVTTIDILRRGELIVHTVSISNERIVTGAHGIPVVADRIFSETDFDSGSVLVLPGGMPGADRLNDHDGLRDLLYYYYDSGKLLAAICAAPLVFGEMGLLEGRKATCYPGFEDRLRGAIVTGNPIEKDGTIITGKGPGFAAGFALALLFELQDPEKATQVAEDLSATW